MKNRCFLLILVLGLGFVLLFEASATAGSLLECRGELPEGYIFTGPEEVTVIIDVRNAGDEDFPGALELYYPDLTQVEEFGSSALAAGSSRSWKGKWEVTQKELEEGCIAFYVLYPEKDETTGKVTAKSKKLSFKIRYVSTESREIWDCPECGRKGNTGNYCGSCAHMAPWMDIPEADLMSAEVPNEEIAEEVSDIIAAGDCGDGLKWQLSDTGELRISGKGEMDYWNEYTVPWYYHRAHILELTIEKGVTNIGSHAFSDCSFLQEVRMPQGIISIDSYAFSNCSGMRKIVIPEGTESIWDCAFYNCSSLEEVVIPESLTMIRPYVFSSCSSLAKIVIPEGVTSIGENAFRGTSLCIYCKKGSYAEGYAQKNNIAYRNE